MGDFLNIKALARVTGAIIIVILVVIAGVGVGLYYATLPSASTPATTAVTATGLHDTLSIDDLWWPTGDLNELTAEQGIPYPNWQMYTVYQSLVTLNGSLVYQTGDIQVLPMLATDWSASPDGTVYTFNLRQNVTFSNGDPFNAYQVWGQMYGFYYLSGNSSGVLNSYNLLDVSNVNFGPATLALMAQSGLINPTSDLLKIMMDNTWPIYVTGPYQIVFHLKAPFRWLPQVLAGYVGLIFDTQYVLQNGGFGTPTTLNPKFNQQPIPGTGPYVVTTVVEQSFVKFAQNPTYWGRSLTSEEIQANPYLDPGHVKTVIMYAKTDDVARYTDLSTGAVDIAGVLTQNWPLVLANPDKYSYFLMPSSSMIVNAIAMNNQRYPTNITAFRQAIVHAVNVTDVSQRVFFGQLAPMVGPEYPAMKEYYDLGSLQPYSYNLTLAKQYLAQSGVNVASLPPLEYRVEAGCTTCIAAAQVIQADLGQLGIVVTVEVTPSTQFTAPYIEGFSTFSGGLAYANQAAHLSTLGAGSWAPSSPTPADNWILWVSNSSLYGDYAIYANPVVQKCVNAWTSTVDTTMITNVCTQAYRQIYDDAPYLWLGACRLAYCGGSLAWNKKVVQSLLMDPVFTGWSTAAVFNTVTFVDN